MWLKKKNDCNRVNAVHLVLIDDIKDSFDMKLQCMCGECDLDHIIDY